MPLFYKAHKQSKDGLQFFLEPNGRATMPIKAELSKDDINIIIDLIESAYLKGVNTGRKDKAREFRELLEE